MDFSVDDSRLINNYDEILITIITAKHLHCNFVTLLLLFQTNKFHTHKNQQDYIINCMQLKFTSNR